MAEKKTNPDCKLCGDTGVWETGNNDLPCPECPKGSSAVFNVCTRDGHKKVTGEQVRRHYLNGSPEPLD